MPWVRIDEAFADHPKIIEAGESAVCLFICGLAYCGHMLSDGVIPKRKARVLYPMNDAAAAADALVRVGLWHEDGDNYVVHDYLDYQPSRAEVEEARSKTKARVEKWRGEKAGSAAQKARNGRVTPLQESYSGVCNDVGNAAPIPIPTPIPSPEPTPTPTPNDASPSGEEPVKQTRIKQDYSKGFEEFYAIYPRHEAKEAARRSWNKLKPTDADMETIMEGVRRYVHHVEANRTEKRYIRLPATWLNGGCWTDEYDGTHTVHAYKPTVWQTEEIDEVTGERWTA